MKIQKRLLAAIMAIAVLTTLIGDCPIWAATSKADDIMKLQLDKDYTVAELDLRKHIIDRKGMDHIGVFFKFKVTKMSDITIKAYKNSGHQITGGKISLYSKKSTIPVCLKDGNNACLHDNLNWSNSTNSSDGRLYWIAGAEAQKRYNKSETYAITYQSLPAGTYYVHYTATAVSGEEFAFEDSDVMLNITGKDSYFGMLKNVRCKGNKKKRTVTVQWKKAKGAQKYEVYARVYTKNKNSGKKSKIVTVKKNKYVFQVKKATMKNLAAIEFFVRPVGDGTKGAWVYGYYEA